MLHSIDKPPRCPTRSRFAQRLAIFPRYSLRKISTVACRLLRDDMLIVCFGFFVRNSGMPRRSSPTRYFIIFRSGDSRIARFCSRYAFGCGSSRTSTPTKVVLNHSRKYIFLINETKKRAIFLILVGGDVPDAPQEKSLCRQYFYTQKGQIRDLSLEFFYNVFLILSVNKVCY